MSEFSHVIHICLGCKVEIPRSFFENPRTNGNTMARLTIDNETYKIVRKEKRKAKGEFNHNIEHEICHILPERERYARDSGGDIVRIGPWAYWPD